MSPKPPCDTSYSSWLWALCKKQALGPSSAVLTPASGEAVVVLGLGSRQARSKAFSSKPFSAPATVSLGSAVGTDAVWVGMYHSLPHPPEGVP